MGTRRRHTPEQIIRKLREGEKLLGQGSNLAEVAKHLEISEATWHRWMAQYVSPLPENWFWPTSRDRN